MLRKNIVSKNESDCGKAGLLGLLLIAVFFLLITLSVKTIFASTTTANQMSVSVYLPLITKAIPQPLLTDPQVIYKEECGDGPDIIVASPATLDLNPDQLSFRATIHNAVGKTVDTEYIRDDEVFISNSISLTDNPTIVDTATWSPSPGTESECGWTIPKGEYEARFYVDGVLLGTSSVTVDGPRTGVFP